MSIYLSLSCLVYMKKKKKTEKKKEKKKEKRKKNEPPVAFPLFHREHTCTLSTNIY